MPSVFIDGESGTTGLQIRERLAASPYRICSVPDALRRDTAARLALMAEVDVVVLCLPDDAAREAVALAASLGQRAPRLLDASTAHRTAPGWVYGFPELAAGQPAAIAAATHVSNPGCYATGAIALLRPLLEHGLIGPEHPISINAVSGYTGGGRGMIEAHEQHGGPAFALYALALGHKHVPEIMQHSGLARRPILVPSVGHFRQGMLVSIPLHLDALPAPVSPEAVAGALREHYAGARHVAVIDLPPDGALDPQGFADPDRLELFVAHRGTQAVLIARLDNLGKGAAGAAVQNLHLMLGNAHG
jgi:N-acetyl-gamma-glutamyl-phosphate reductase